MNSHQTKQKIAVALLLPLLACAALAQTPPPQTADALPEKIRQMQEANVRNEQQLRKYQWIETTTLTIHDEPRPPKRSICKYGPDGKVQKTSLGQQEASQGQQGAGFPGRGGLVRGLVMKKKKEEAQKELAQIRTVAEMYFPLDRAKLKQALQSGQLHFATDDPNEETVAIDSYANVSVTISPETALVGFASRSSESGSPGFRVT